MKTQTRKYDPGTKGRIIPEGNGRFTVQSFRDRVDDYSVDLNEATCTCGHFIHRGVECKHQKAARLEAYKIARAKAETLPLETLKILLAVKEYRPEVKEAVEFTIWEREKGAALIGDLITL
jgi:hypothetical protein